MAALLLRWGHSLFAVQPCPDLDRLMSAGCVCLHQATRMGWTNTQCVHLFVGTALHAPAFFPAYGRPFTYVYGMPGQCKTAFGLGLHRHRQRHGRRACLRGVEPRGRTGRPLARGRIPHDVSR